MIQLLVVLFTLLATPALAANPTCPTRPVGDSSNACASTAFVAGATAGLGPGGLNGQIQYNDAGAFGGLTDAQVAARIGPATYNMNTLGGVTCNGATNVSTAFQTALNTAAAAGESAFWTGTCVVSNISIPNNAVLLGSGQGTAKLLRPASDATTNPVLSSSGTTGWRLANFTVDGNVANETNAGSNIVVTASAGNFNITNGTTQNAKFSAGGGIGVSIQDTGDGTNNTQSMLENVSAISNPGGGVLLNYTTGTVDNLTISDYYSFGSVGINSLYTAGTSHKIVNLKIDRFTVNCNNASGAFGVELQGYIQQLVGGQPVYNFLDNAVWKSTVSNGLIENCPGYGLLDQSEDSSVVGVHTINSGGTSPFAGMLTAGYKLTVSNNTVDWVGLYGIEAGGCVECTINGNVIIGVTSQPPATSYGLHLGGAIDTVAVGNIIAPSNSSTSYGILAASYDGADATHGFNWEGAGLTIADNRIACNNSGGCSGIVLQGMSAELNNNNVITSSPTIAYQLFAQVSYGGRNTINLPSGDSYSVASASTLLIPDDPRSISVTGTTTVNNILTYSQAQVGLGVAFFTMTNGGSSYTSSPTASFTGGTCSVQPTAIMFINPLGVVTGGQMSGFGTCTATPTGMSFSGGGGTGAAATPSGISGLINGRLLTLIPVTGFTITHNAGGFGTVDNRSGSNLSTLANGVYLYGNVNGTWGQNQ